MNARAVALVLGLLATVYSRTNCAGHARRDVAGIAFHPHRLTRQERPRVRDLPDAKTTPQDSAPTHRIPFILHHIYLGGYTAFVEEAAKPRPKVTKEFYDSCQAAHRHWESKFWDAEAALTLLREHYTWFLPIYENYNSDDKRMDALRIFILHKYGGLYLDLDIECYRAADDSFSEYEVVLQGTGDEGINNAAMASVPGHSLWQHYAKVLVERSTQGADTARNAAMWMSGTLALSNTLFAYVKAPKRPISGYLGGEHAIPGGILKIYPIGEWYVPCYGVDLICKEQYERGREKGEWDMTNIFGRHYFYESSRQEILEAKLKPVTVVRDRL